MSFKITKIGQEKFSFTDDGQPRPGPAAGSPARLPGEGWKRARRRHPGRQEELSEFWRRHPEDIGNSFAGGGRFPGQNHLTGLTARRQEETPGQNCGQAEGEAGWRWSISGFSTSRIRSGKSFPKFRTVNPPSPGGEGVGGEGVWGSAGTAPVCWITPTLTSPARGRAKARP
jgi:hypothetical protein